jgi:hypothetical protein
VTDLWTLFKELFWRVMWSHTAFYAGAIFVTVLILCLLLYGQFFR